jgi:hypothetical protein
LFIIINTPPELQPEDNDLKVQRRWELERTQGAMFFWTVDRGGFEWEGGKRICDKALCKLIEKAGNELVEDFRKDRKRSFEVRPVFVVRK